MDRLGRLGCRDLKLGQGGEAGKWGGGGGVEAEPREGSKRVNAVLRQPEEVGVGREPPSEGTGVRERPRNVRQDTSSVCYPLGHFASTFLCWNLAAWRSAWLSAVAAHGLAGGAVTCVQHAGAPCRAAEDTVATLQSR